MHFCDAAVFYILKMLKELCSSKLCRLFRSCAGPRAGDGCVVCHSPAWVKDIQINRQLSSIVQLLSGLESLLSPADQPGRWLHLERHQSII